VKLLRTLRQGAIEMFTAKHSESVLLFLVRSKGKLTETVIEIMKVFNFLTYFFAEIFGRILSDECELCLLLCYGHRICCLLCLSSTSVTFSVSCQPR